MPQPPIESIVLRAINQGLDVLGESPKKALLYHLENGLGISWENAFTEIERLEGETESREVICIYLSSWIALVLLLAQSGPSTRREYNISFVTSQG